MSFKNPKKINFGPQPPPQIPNSSSGTFPKFKKYFLIFFFSICAHQTPNGRKEKRRREFWEKKAEKGIFPREEKRLRARLDRKEKSPKSQKPPELGRSDPHRDFYDIWAEHSEFGGDLGKIWDFCGV